ncbi:MULTISPECIES: Dyp-type peroxidase [unclassified Corynebacterium]|uniref:Dyp-type peroxidase n=1 Tax=unclassified Corynebacterium TaxID=2624378 RepID=UPI001EF6EC60|nr:MULTISPECIES: Dyp-type peroxidase [unclassified Corynebacterium]MCG7288672.1 Dyp-type peroxidase [Corynebacterium sp. ACRPZ]MCG7293022.1 Dyp-type peroxidase [Corynebacterium sp. ACRPY]
MTSKNQAEVTQTVILPQSRDALFITLGFKEGGEAAALEVLSSLSSLTNAVGFRYPKAHLTAVAGIGAKMWDRLFALDKPEHLHEFVELQGAKHHAPSTPGDLFFHIRSDEFDVAFELGRRINAIVEDHIDYHDEVHAFQYQDFRDPLGFVDGTESPRGQEGVEVAIIRDGIWKGGSYIVEQKYVHNLKDWNDLPVEEQEQVIGRTKHSDIELDEKAPNSHVAVNQVEDEDGNGLEIVRNNLSFGDALGKQGTFFMSYARDPRVTEVMLRRMFIGEPEGNYDRILDFSEALTGCNFFAPPRVFLDHCADYAHPHLRGEGGEEPNQPAINLPQGKAVFPDRADVPTSHNAEDVEAAKARFEGALRREQ